MLEICALQYLLYVGRDANSIVILIGDCAKKFQQNDIDAAMATWKEYKRGNRQENLDGIQ